MQHAIIHRYGPAADVLKLEAMKMPELRKGQILIRQHATSVNPIDCRMRKGYGRVALSRMRGFELPLVLGRDVSGVVAAVAPDVKGLAVGDAVYGVPAAKAQGAYADWVVSTPADVVHKPRSLSFTEAAALPYVACTVWDALVAKAGLTADNARGKKVFVQAGAGGIGSFAIQLLKAWGAQVATTCSKDQMESVHALGADVVIDYQVEDYATRLSNCDVALETVGGALEEKTLGILRKDGKGRFTTLIHPLLANFDESGLVVGAVRNFRQFNQNRARAKKRGVGGYYWSTFKSRPEALIAVRELVERGQIRPHIDRMFELKDLAAAHEYCELGKANGKIIVRMASGESSIPAESHVAKS